MEKQAFQEVRVKNTNHVRRFLSSKAYNDNQDRYALGMRKLFTRMDNLVAARVDSKRNQIQTVQNMSDLLGGY